MKTLNSKAVTIVLAAIIFFTTYLKAQDSLAIEIQHKIELKQFTFVAETLVPLRGSNRVLPRSEYDVYVNKDSIISYLPFFGRSTSAPMSSDEAGIRFTSTSFKYDAALGKKKRWEIKIKPTDVHTVQQFDFTVFNNGTAVLNVTSTFRDPITFYGYIK